MTSIVHPNYNPSTTNNDIALLKLSESVDLSIYTPACLPASSADYVGQSAKVYGRTKIFFLTVSIDDIVTQSVSESDF